MATERLSMHKSREILRLKWLLDKSHRDIARSLKGSVGAVSNVLTRAAEAGLNDWPAVEALSDEALEEKLYGVCASVGGQRPMPDPLYLQRERRRPGVTLELLHLEYLEQHPDGYRYTQFCEYYRQWLKTRGLTMRQVHKAIPRVSPSSPTPRSASCPRRWPSTSGRGSDTREAAVSTCRPGPKDPPAAPFSGC
jgi:hypothetical protein